MMSNATVSGRAVSMACHTGSIRATSALKRSIAQNANRDYLAEHTSVGPSHLDELEIHVVVARLRVARQK